MKHIKFITTILILAVTTLLSCEMEGEMAKARREGIKPTLTTNAVTEFTATSATLGGTITNAGIPVYTERGVVYATNPNPTTADNKIPVAGTGTGHFSTIVSGLEPNATFYVRTYATNAAGTEYGEQESFFTTTVTINTQPRAYTTVQFGNITGSLSVSASAPDATLSYQWFASTSPSNSRGEEITGETSTTFTIPTTLTIGTYYYFCEVRATGGAKSVRSNVATVNVQVASISINTQPTAINHVQFGSISGSLSLNASVSLGATLSYQWYASTSPSNSSGTEISGETSATFIIPTTLTVGTYYYFCEVSATGVVTSVRSNVATVNVIHVDADMVLVKGRIFLMGATGIATPVHQVTLNDFIIGKYEVTQALWIEVMGSNPSWFKGDNLPVETVSWNDIVGTSGASMVINGITYRENGFIYKLNQLTGKQYRLPTEAEWEYAARGGNKSQGYQYSGSNNVNDVAWYSGNNTPYGTKPVGTKAPNELGIYDMSGNVWEWCSDWWGSYTSAAKTNPTGPTSGTIRVIRGGSWYLDATNCRVAYRDYCNPDYRIFNFGFRLVLAL